MRSIISGGTGVMPSPICDHRESATQSSGGQMCPGSGSTKLPSTELVSAATTADGRSARLELHTGPTTGPKGESTPLRSLTAPNSVAVTPYTTDSRRGNSCSGGSGLHHSSRLVRVGQSSLPLSMGAVVKILYKNGPATNRRDKNRLSFFDQSSH